ncbi:EF hand family protein [Histomonas meleagridis]|uniref:EF hand family protein n=1 Tax=Histomonas meleagridis TaxID=135588 RepID=UPI00355952DA|nr:EF hand family protein [Histomonas meleagridis]KAH0806715.1 EF hand family protein [Histomonas meleagridis]
MKDGRIEHAKSFSPEELQEVKEIFMGMDADGNGVLDREEMSEFLTKLDMEGELADLMFAIYDHDGNGVLDFDEFCHFAKDMMQTSENPLYFVGVLFSALDTDKSGALSGDELARFLKLLGINSNPEDFGDKEITLAEFLTILS